MLTFFVHGVVSKVDVVHWRYHFQCADLSSSKNIAQKYVQNQYLASKLELAYALALCQKKKHGWTVNNVQVVKSQILKLPLVSQNRLK
jgi:hypothetical protein